MLALLLHYRLDTLLLATVAVLAVRYAQARGAGSSPDTAEGRYPRGLLVTVSAAWLLGALAAEAFAARERNHLREALEGYAPIYARELERLGLLEITIDTPPDDATYLELIDAQRQWLATNPTVADIYTYLRLPDGRIALAVDSETDYDRNGKFEGEREARTAIGEPYEEDAETRDAFAGHTTFNDNPYQDRWGTWVSANVPVPLGSANPVAVVGVDYHARTWLFAQLSARLVPVLFAMVLILVLTALAAREAELRVRFEVESVSRAREALVANVSHEMRTPLNGILGLTELMLESPLSEVQRDWLGTIRESASVLLHLINDVLDLSKLRAGSLQIQKAPFDLHHEIEGIFRVLGPEARRKGIALRIEWPPNLGSAVGGDKYRIRQVLTNLVANAVKFTDHGSVTVRAVRQDPDRSDVLSVAVLDTGIGLDPTQAEKLFHAFEQGDSTATRRYGGTGLGLTISRMLVERMGGRIEVDGSPDQGATFTIHLPLEPAEVPEEPTRPSIAALRTVDNDSDYRVLVVEDSAVNRKVLSLQLDRLGMGYDFAEDGLQAVEKATVTRYSMILMDCQMPVMDGLEATRRIRSLSAGSNDAPIVALTASAMPGDREKCLAAGMTDYLAKPVGIEALATVVHRWSNRVAAAHVA